MNVLALAVATSPPTPWIARERYTEHNLLGRRSSVGAKFVIVAQGEETIFS
jgi:hypothetical protein